VRYINASPGTNKNAAKNSVFRHINKEINRAKNLVNQGKVKAAVTATANAAAATEVVSNGSRNANAAAASSRQQQGAQRGFLERGFNRLRGRGGNANASPAASNRQQQGAQRGLLERGLNWARRGVNRMRGRDGYEKVQETAPLNPTGKRARELLIQAIQQRFPTQNIANTISNNNLSRMATLLKNRNNINYDTLVYISKLSNAQFTKYKSLNNTQKASINKNRNVNVNNELNRVNKLGKGGGAGSANPISQATEKALAIKRIKNRYGLNNTFNKSKINNFTPNRLNRIANSNTKNFNTAVYLSGLNKNQRITYSKLSNTKKIQIRNGDPFAKNFNKAYNSLKNNNFGNFQSGAPPQNSGAQNFANFNRGTLLQKYKNQYPNNSERAKFVNYVLSRINKGKNINGKNINVGILQTNYQNKLTGSMI
jgi:hypothetical protein